MSIMQIMDSSYYNKSTGQWEKYAPKSIAEAVATADGSNVQVKLDAIPGQITAAKDNAIAEVRANVAESGNTLAKLYTLVKALQELVASDDVSLDTVQEIADYIKANRDDLTLMGTNKVDYDDIVNNLTTVSTVTGKVLDARQGKIMKDTIDTLSASLSTLQALSSDFATKTEVTTAVSSAMPIISEAAPSNPLDRQIWLRPISSVEV